MIQKLADLPARAYNMSVEIYSVSKQIIVQEGCFAFMFTNIGGATAKVNGMVIFPSSNPATILGDSRSIGAELLDIYKGNIVLSFTPGAPNPLVEIVQLFYM